MITYIGNATTSQGYQYRKGVIDDVVKYCSDKSYIAIDTETTGLDYIDDKIVMLQIGDKDHQFVIDVRCTDITPLKNIFESEDIIKIFHNAKFDCLFLKSQFELNLRYIHDTMLTERVLKCGRKMKYSLKALVSNYFNIELDKNIRTTFNNKTPFTKEQIEYGAKDIEYLIDLREEQIKLTNKYNLHATVNLENKVVLAFVDMEFNGIDLDRDAWENLSKINKEKADKLREQLDDYILNTDVFIKFKNQHIQTDLFIPVDDIRTVSVNWDSPKQVLEVFQTLESKIDNVNAKYLYKYSSKHPIIKTYTKYKEAMKLCTSYGMDFFNNLKSDGKIHTSFHQILDTGRVSSSGPNMQQIPADNTFRNCFVPPIMDGWKFVSADYSSQELNVIAFGSKDPVWIKALEDGEDLHSVCAELVYGDDWLKSAEDNCNYMVSKSKCNCSKHKILRTNVKTINFGLAYGMGPHKLADTLNIPINDAKDLIKKYFASFPAIGGFLDKLANFGKKFGYIKTFPPYNRRRWFDTWYPGIWKHSSSKRELGMIERASKNTPIQGASADMTKLALIYIKEYIEEYNLPVKLVMTVHDQIDTVCNSTFVDEWAVLLRELMESAAKKIVTNGLLEAEVTISDYWQK